MAPSLQFFTLLIISFLGTVWMSQKCSHGQHFFTNCTNPCEVNGTVTFCESSKEAVCIPEYCGGCLARFYDNKSREIHCQTREGVICEMKTHLIGCERNFLISMLSANYGRTSKSVCRHPFDIERLHNDTECRAPISLSVMQTLCNRKQTCTVTVDGKLFGKDPCYGTYKYLEFNFTCVKNKVPSNVGSSPPTAAIVVAIVIPILVIVGIVSVLIYIVRYTNFSFRGIRYHRTTEPGMVLHQ